MTHDPTLSDLRAEFGRGRFLAMPIAGAIAWTAAGVLGALLPTGAAALAMFFCIGMTFGLGVLIGRILGEDLLGKERRDNPLDRLFLLTVLMANLVWGIAIPFFMIEKSSLPLSLGILAGLMWVPFSWMIQHWVGIFHGVARTLSVVATWYLLPAQRFTAIPAVIVAIYLISIAVLATRKLPEPAAAERA
jgi:ethanolamine transporter EutH